MAKRTLQQIEESLRSKLAEQPSRLPQLKSQSIQLNEQGLLSKLITKWGPDAIEWFSKNKGISRDAAKEEFRKEQLRLANLNPAQKQAEKEALSGQFGVPKKDIKAQEPKLSSELTPQQRVEPKLSGQRATSEPATANKPGLSPEPQTTKDNLVQQAQQHLRDTGEQSLIIDSPRLAKILDKLFPEKLSDLSKQRIDPKIDETRLTEANLSAENLEQLRQDPRVRLMLDLLSRAEGRYQVGGKENLPTDYDTIVGNLGPKAKLRITDFSRHPQITAVTTKYGPSNAAGRYQIVYPTWEGQVKKLAKQGIDIKDFSPESQDKVAIAILNDVGALDQLLKGNFKQATHLSRNQWMSLPGTSSPQGKGPKGPAWVNDNIADLKKFHNIPTYYAVGDSQAVGVASQGGELWNKSMARTGASILDPKQFKEHLANIERIPPGSVVAISGGGNDINSAKPEVIADQVNKLIAAAKARGINVVHLLPTSTDDPKMQQKREDLRQAMVKLQNLAPIVDLGQASKKDPMKLHLDPKAYQVVAQKVTNMIPMGTATAATDKDKPAEKIGNDGKSRDQWLSDFDRRQAELEKERKQREEQLKADQALLDKLQAEKDRKAGKKTKPEEKSAEKKPAEKKPYEPWEPDFPKSGPVKTDPNAALGLQGSDKGKVQPPSSVPDLRPKKIKPDSDLSVPPANVVPIVPKSERPANKADNNTTSRQSQQSAGGVIDTSAADAAKAKRDQEKADAEARARADAEDKASKNKQQSATDANTKSKTDVRKDFERAFATARAQQVIDTGKGSGGTFIWKDPRTGKEGLFTTDYGDEVPSPKVKKNTTSLPVTDITSQDTQNLARWASQFTAEPEKSAAGVLLDPDAKAKKRRQDDLDRIMKQYDDPVDDSGEDEIEKIIKSTSVAAPPTSYQDSGLTVDLLKPGEQSAVALKPKPEFIAKGRDLEAEKFRKEIDDLIKKSGIYYPVKEPEKNNEKDQIEESRGNFDDTSKLVNTELLEILQLAGRQ